MANTKTTTLRNPDTIHAPLGAYSHQVEIPAGARWLAMAGQVGADRDGHVSNDPVEQARQCLENIRRNVEAAGMEVSDIVKLTVVRGRRDGREAPPGAAQRVPRRS